ncbi:MAG: hypothetical protein GC162_20695 [Planctomycetes bacterium]|nr:hypothetical protein [Planctomycetota bacterium]
MNQTATGSLAARRGMPPALAAMAVLCVALFTNLWALGEGPLARTEGHRALTGHEMVTTGQWLVPHLYGKAYVRKPPGMYWAIAIVESIAGRADELIWRLPSAIGAAAMAMILWAFGRRWFGETAGLVSGLSYCGLVALWAQNRSADIDALNTLASATAALVLIELGFGSGEKRWAWSLVLAAATGATLLLKGPAGLPVMGGAIVGASVMNRHWRWLARPSTWGGLLVGLIVFGAWAWLALTFVREHAMTQDMTGVNEVASRLSFTDGERLRDAALLGPELLVLGLPLTLAIPFVMLRSAGEAMSESERRLSRALVGAFIAAIVISMLALLNRPRYGYMVLTLLCPLAGCVVELWRRGGYGEMARTRLRQISTVSTLALVGLSLGLIAISWREAHESRPLLITSGVLIALVGAVSLFAWITQRRAIGGWTLVMLIALAALPFNAFKTAQEFDHSGRAAGLVMRDIVGADATIAAELAVMNNPELFHYAQVHVVRYPRGMSEIMDRPDPCWVVFDAREWAKWSSQRRDALTQIHPLPLENKPVLAWFSGAGHP